MLKEQLRQVACVMDRMLREDPFPEAVKPAHLARAVRDYPARGGKRLRPAVTLWCCGAVGGATEQALDAAAAMEVFHNWTLVHDDIIDRDEFRRGEPTAHHVLRDFAASTFGSDPSDAAKYGCDFALLAGDVQQAWAQDLLLRSVARGVDASLVLALARRMAGNTNRLLISGEALDVEFALRDPDELTLEEVRSMIRLKTGILIESAAVTGAAIGCGSLDDPRVALLGEALSDASLAFQLRDDELGIYGNGETFGKPLGSDLREGKPTVLLLTALSNEAYREEVRTLLRRARSGEDVLSRGQKLFESCGAAQAVRDESKELVRRSKERLLTLDDTPYRALLLELTDYFVTRER